MSIMPTAMMAQRYYNSPLSRFNIGTLENSASVRSMGMGGTGIAVRVNDQVYESNPASYSAIDTNCFVFDFGLDYGILTLSDETDKYKSDDMSFHHLKLAFPLNKKIGTVEVSGVEKKLGNLRRNSSHQKDLHCSLSLLSLY